MDWNQSLRFAPPRFGLALAVLLLVLAGIAGCAQPPRVGDVLEPVAVLRGPQNDAVLKLAVSPDGKYVAAKLYDRKHIYVWDVTQKKLVYRLAHSHTSEVTFTPGGKHLLTGDYVPRSEQLLRDEYGNTLRDDHGKERMRDLKPEERFIGHLWDLPTGQKAKTYYYGNDERDVCWFTGMQYSRDGKNFAKGGRNGLYLCDAETARPIRFIPYPWLVGDKWKEAQTKGEPYLGDAEQFVMHPDWRTALVAAMRYYPKRQKDERWEQEVVLLWFDLQSGTVVREVSAIKPAIGYYGVALSSLAVDREGKQIAVATKYLGATITAPPPGPVRIFHIGTAQLVREIPFTGQAASMAFGPDGRTLFVAGDRLTLWEVSTGRKLGEFKDRYVYGNLKQVALSADGCTLAMGGDYTVIYVWSVKNCRRAVALN